MGFSKIGDVDDKFDDQVEISRKFVTTKSTAYCLKSAINREREGQQMFNIDSIVINSFYFLVPNQYCFYYLLLIAVMGMAVLEPFDQSETSISFD